LSPASNLLQGGVLRGVLLHRAGNLILGFLTILTFFCRWPFGLSDRFREVVGPAQVFYHRISLLNLSETVG